MKKLLLIGAGHAHAEVLRQFALQPAANAAITLLSPQALAPCAAMLPGLVAGIYTHAQCHIDLRALAAKAGIELMLDRAAGLDLEGRLAHTAGGRKLEFDFVSIDIGAVPFAAEVPGLRRFALLARPTEVFLEGWERVRELAREGGLSRLTMVGGDVRAVELMLAMQYRLREELAPAAFAACGFSIVTAAARLLDSLPPAAGLALEALCVARGISLVRGATVILVERGGLLLSNRARLTSDITVWSDGATPARWLAASGLACDEQGFMLIDASLRSPGNKRVYGAGDCSVSTTDQFPATPGRAVLQGAALAASLRLALAGEPPLPAAGAAAGVGLISLGSRQAIAVHGPLVRTWPRWLIWRFRDWRDRHWMTRFRL